MLLRTTCGYPAIAGNPILLLVFLIFNGISAVAGDSSILWSPIYSLGSLMLLTLRQFAGVTAIADFPVVYGVTVVTIPAVRAGPCVSNIFANFRIYSK